jgi:pilus assembly protein Flp/PilA
MYQQWERPEILRNRRRRRRRKEVIGTMLFLPREEGQGLVEYALILVLVAIVVIAILLLLGPVIGNVFSNIVGNL